LQQAIVGFQGNFGSGWTALESPKMTLCDMAWRVPSRWCTFNFKRWWGRSAAGPFH
jgi:hypothetical protein